MGAGKYDRWIKLLKREPGNAVDGFGAATPSDGWLVMTETWAEFKPMSSTERVGLLTAHHATQVVKFAIRYIEGVSAAGAIEWEGRRYRIVDVQEPERRRELFLVAVVGQTQAGPSDAGG